MQGKAALNLWRNGGILGTKCAQGTNGNPSAAHGSSPECQDGHIPPELVELEVPPEAGKAGSAWFVLWQFTLLEPDARHWPCLEPKKKYHPHVLI